MLIIWWAIGLGSIAAEKLAWRASTTLSRAKTLGQFNVSGSYSCEPFDKLASYTRVSVFSSCRYSSSTNVGRTRGSECNDNGDGDIRFMPNDLQRSPGPLSYNSRNADCSNPVPISISAVTGVRAAMTALYGQVQHSTHRAAHTLGLGHLRLETRQKSIGPQSHGRCHNVFLNVES